MTTKNEAGMVASHRFPMYTSHNGKLLPEYAWRYFSSPRGKYDLGIASPGGAGRNKTLGQAEFNQLKIPVPSLAHQRMVVDALAAADRAIARTGDLITAKRRLKKRLADTLLTGEYRFSEFLSYGAKDTTWKGTRVGRLPADWKCVRLGDISRINPRALSDSTPPDYRFWYIDLSMVKLGSVQFPKHMIRFADSPSRARRVVTKRDITLATVRPNLLGYAYWPDVTSDIVCSTGFAVVQVTDGSPEFMYHWLYSTQVARYFHGCIAGSSYPALNPADVKNIPVPHPPKAEQIRIAAVLTSTDRQIALLEIKLASLQKVKMGLMQKLLRVRREKILENG